MTEQGWLQEGVRACIRERKENRRQTTAHLANAEIVFLSVFVPLSFSAELTGTARGLLKTSVSLAFLAAGCGVLELWLRDLLSSGSRGGWKGRALYRIRSAQATVAPASFLASLALAAAAAVLR